MQQINQEEYTVFLQLMYFNKTAELQNALSILDVYLDMFINRDDSFLPLEKVDEALFKHFGNVKKLIEQQFELYSLIEETKELVT